MLPAGRCGIPPPPIGLAGRGGVAAAGCGAMGRAGAGCGIDGVAGLGVIAGFGTAAAAAAGFFAAAGFVAGVRFAAGLRAAGFLAAGLRAGALRAVVFRAAGRRAAVLRAVVLRAAARRAVLFRAGAFLAAVFLAADFLAVVFFAAVFCAPVFFAPDRAALALRPVVLRELVFLLAVRFFPVVLVAMVLLRFSSVAAGARRRRTRACTNHVSQVQACRPTRRVNCFFHYTLIAAQSGNLAGKVRPSRQSILSRPARAATTRACIAESALHCARLTRHRRAALRA